MDEPRSISALRSSRLELVAELHEAVLTAQAGQDDRRTELAGLATMRAEQFARRFVADDEIDAESRVFSRGRGGKGHRIRAGLPRCRGDRPQGGDAADPNRLGIRLGAPSCAREAPGGSSWTASGVKAIRDAVPDRGSRKRGCGRCARWRP